MSEILAADVRPFTTAEPNPEQAIARREIRNAIEKEVDELPSSFRSVFMLRAIEQMSVEETASYSVFLAIRSRRVSTAQTNCCGRH